jgi:opacity protein-like surface antigen
LLLEAKMKVQMRFVALALTALVLTVSSSAVATDARKVEVVAAYGFLHDSGMFDGTSFPVGWNAGATFNLSPALGIVGEFGGSRKSESVSEFGVTESANLNVYSFMAGPKFTSRGHSRVSPYVQALVGLARVSFGVSVDGFGFSGSASESATELAIQPGGGVDILLSERIALRVGGDYRRIFGDVGTNEFRLVSGLTFGFGEPIPAR